MLSVEEALEKVLSRVQVLEPEDGLLMEVLGQVLAEDIYSTLDIPPLDNSAMDGYAARARDTSRASVATPRVLKVVGEVAAGYLPQVEVGAGEALRIMTGAPIPRGADTVVQFEDTDEVARKQSGQPLTEIGVLRSVPDGLNIRRAGEDIARGDLVLRQGTVLRPQEIGVLASLGREVVSVVRRPVVSVLATGDELVDVKEPLALGKIYNSNTYTIATQVMRYGGIPRVLGIARDDVASLTRKIKEGLQADLFITSAGVSTGEYDVVKDVLAQQGQIDFWTVRMKPGKPLAFGVLRAGKREVPHLGLPGNPVSSMIAFEQFARPAILKMMGKKDWTKPVIQAISESAIPNRDGRRIFARAVVSARRGNYYARVTGEQGSGILTSMVKCNGLMVVPETVSELRQGDEVLVQMLDWDLGN